MEENRSSSFFRISSCQVNTKIVHKYHAHTHYCCTRIFGTVMETFSNHFVLVFIDVMISYELFKLCNSNICIYIYIWASVRFVFSVVVAVNKYVLCWFVLIPFKYYDFKSNWSFSHCFCNNNNKYNNKKKNKNFGRCFLDLYCQIVSGNKTVCFSVLSVLFWSSSSSSFVLLSWFWYINIRPIFEVLVINMNICYFRKQSTMY